MSEARLEEMGVLQGVLEPPTLLHNVSDHYTVDAAMLAHFTPCSSGVVRAMCTGLESIELDGSEYILTDIVPDGDTRVEMGFRCGSVNGKMFLFGSSGSDYQSTDGFSWAIQSDKCFCQFGSGGSSALQSVSAGSKHNIILEWSGAFFDNGILMDFTHTSWQSETPLCIGSVNRGGTAEYRCFKGEIFYVRVFRSGVLTHDLVPVVSDLGVCGLYDLVGHHIYPCRSALGETVIMTEATPYLFCTGGTRLLDYRIYGRSEGIGTKTANLLPVLNSERTSRGITFTPAGDGTVIVNGTAEGGAAGWAISDDVAFIGQGAGLELPPGNYMIYPPSSGTYTVGLQARVRHPDSTYAYSPNGFTVAEGDRVEVQIRVAQGVSLDNEVIRPQLEQGSSCGDFEPYGYRIPFRVYSDGQTNTAYFYRFAPLGEGEVITMSETGVTMPTATGNNYAAVDTFIQPPAVTITFEFENRGI